MSDFPAKILLATDGSEDAELAARAAISLAEDTGAELHVVHVGEAHPAYPAPTVAGPPLPAVHREELENEARGLLDEQVEKMRQAGREVAEARLRVGNRPRRSSA